MAFMNLAGSEQGYDALQPLINFLNGGPASAASITGVNDDGAYAVTLENQGTGGHLNIPGEIQVESDGTGTVIRALSLTDLTVTGNTILGNAVGDTLTVNATSTFVNPATFSSTATVNGTFATTAATNLGDGSGDAITVMGTTTFRNAANTDTQMYVDPSNARVQIGTATALTGATSSRLEVTGRVYLTPASASEDLLTLWRSPSAGSGWTIGVTATPNGQLKFKDDGGSGIVTFGDFSSMYQLEVTGDGHFTDDCYVDGDLTGARVAVGATSWSGSEELRVVGQTRLEGQLVVTTGGVDVTGSSTFATATTFSSSIDVNGGALITNITVDGTGTPFTFSGTSQTATTVGAAGGASALPATPSGYLKITVGATDYKIPYYLA